MLCHRHRNSAPVEVCLCSRSKFKQATNVSYKNSVVAVAMSAESDTFPNYFTAVRMDHCRVWMTPCSSHCQLQSYLSHILHLAGKKVSAQSQEPKMALTVQTIMASHSAVHPWSPSARQKCINADSPGATGMPYTTPFLYMHNFGSGSMSHTLHIILRSRRANRAHTQPQLPPPAT